MWLDDDPQASVHALCYVVDRGHRQYAGRLSIAEQLHYARQGHGRSGACRDYVLAAVKELQSLGIRDAELQRPGRTTQGYPSIFRHLIPGASHPKTSIDRRFRRLAFLPGPLQSSGPSQFRCHSAAEQRMRPCRDPVELDQEFPQLRCRENAEANGAARTGRS